MNNKLVIIKTDKNSGNKELIAIILESIYDIKRKHNNIYIMKQLIELEKKIKQIDNFSYELKLISEEEIEIYLTNCEINGRNTPQTGSFLTFLTHYARSLHSAFYKEQPKCAGGAC